MRFPAEVVFAGDEQGVALLLRLDGRPVHFSLHSQPPGSRLDGDALWRLAGTAAAEAVLAQAIRDELAPPVSPARVNITVAVCTRAREELLEPCLRSLLALAGDADEVDILVVDNDPPDAATAELVASLAGVRYICEPRAGLDFARNRALSEARGDFIAYLDDDVVADRGWLSGLREALAENPDAGVVTGLVLPRELATHAQVIFERRGGFRRGLRKLRYDGSHQPGNALYPLGAGMFGAGANMAFRRDALRRLGGFDEALDTGAPLPGGGDLDAFSRMIRAGHPIVYEPCMLVLHRHRREHEALRRQYWSWGEGFTAYVAKTYGAAPNERRRLRGLIAWWVPYELRELGRCALGRGWGPPDLPLAELAGGIAGLTGSYRRSRRRVEGIRRAHG